MRPAGGRLAVVAGHTVLDHDVAADLGMEARTRRVPVPGGPVTVGDAGDVVLVQRHGTGPGYRPAHRLDHPAHAAALARLGCARVLAVASVGGLRPHLGVGTVVIPDDFLALGARPDSRYPDERGHTVPGFDPGWRARVVGVWRAHAATAPVDGGVYWQTTGPRFETPAEVRLFAAFADVVGMTVGSEAIACRERGMAYAAVCIVDNLANGVGAAPLSVEEFEAGKAANRAVTVRTLRAVIRELAG